MSRGGIETQIIENSEVGLGDNEFETGLITVPGNSKIKKGVVLKRAGSKFAPVTNTATEKPVAVNPKEIENKNAAPADLSLRAIISGPVRADLLLIGNNVTTDDQNDMLRATSIIPIKQNDISRTE